MFEYFLTGSNIYGVKNSESDIDIVLKQEDANQLKKHLELKNICVQYVKHNKGYGGYYFNLLGLKFNICVCGSELERKGWKYATEVLKTLPPIEDKEMKKNKFKMLVHQYMMDIQWNGEKND